MNGRMFELIIQLKRKCEFFPTSFAVILLAVAMPIMLKAKFNLELILYIIIFCFLKSQQQLKIRDLYSKLT